MPPADYRFMHKGTDVSPEETNSVCAWSQKVGTTDDDDKKDEKTDVKKGEKKDAKKDEKKKS